MVEGQEVTVVDATPKVYAAIAAVQKGFSEMGLGKKDRNDFHKYDFRGIDALMIALSPLLVKHGLIILPRGVARTSEERRTNEGKASFRVTLDIDYSIICVEDATLVTVGPFYGEAMDTSDKATNKAMSFAYKYMAFQTFCIPITGQDEGDNDSPEVAASVAGSDTPPPPEPKKKQPPRELPQNEDADITEEQLNEKIGFGKCKDHTWSDVQEDDNVCGWVEWLAGQEDDEQGKNHNAAKARAVLAHYGL